jgi:hypothetical protein
MGSGSSSPNTLIIFCIGGDSGFHTLDGILFPKSSFFSKRSFFQ